MSRFTLTRLGEARKAPPEVRARGAAWAAAHPPAPVAPDAVVTFAIPLYGRDAVSDWDLVCRNLRATLRSLAAQTSPRWRAIICGQDAPDGAVAVRAAVDGTPADGAEVDGAPGQRGAGERELAPGVTFLPYPRAADADATVGAPGGAAGGAPAATRFDKPGKVARMIDHLTAGPGPDGYFFLLDADDLVHPRLVEHVTGSGERAGFVMTRGYMLDAATGAMAYHGENRLRYPRSARFCSHCGSSSLIRMDLRAPEAARAPLMDRGPHARAMHAAAAYGLRLRKLPFPGAIYVVNHGDNMRLKRGRQDSKLRYLAANRVSGRARARVAAEFGLDALRGPGQGSARDA